MFKVIIKATTFAAIGLFTMLSTDRACALAATRTMFAGESRVAPSKESVVYTFRGGTDGADPVAAVIADPSGNLYGTTSAGGNETACSGGCGTVFRLTALKKELVLYRFMGGADGEKPEGALLIDANGDLFGTTFNGGSTNCAGGCGTVFELVPNANKSQYVEKILHRFANDPDGAHPAGALIVDKTGALLGTTVGGGSGGYPCTANSGSCGTVFKLTPQGSGYKEHIAYSFQVPPDAIYPNPNIVIGKGGTIYGSAWGGSNGCTAPNDGCGTVFGLTKSGSGYVENLLLTLPAPNGTGPFPVGGVIQDASGAFYGMQGISVAYPFPANGAAYKLIPGSNGSYTESFIHNFTNVPDGSAPQAAFIMDKTGTLFGTTLDGGSSNCGCGTVFKLTPSGSNYTETILYDFLRGSDGMYPASALLEQSGALYGTTTQGGSFTNCTAGCGTVFKVTQ